MMKMSYWARSGSYYSLWNRKTKMIAFRKKIFDKIGIEKENANHLLLLKEDEDKKDFLSLYNHPVLKKNQKMVCLLRYLQ